MVREKANFANRIIKHLKPYTNSMDFEDSHTPYKAAFSSTPSYAAPNPMIKQLYIDEHFCCAYKYCSAPTIWALSGLSPFKIMTSFDSIRFSYL